MNYAPVLQSCGLKRISIYTMQRSMLVSFPGMEAAEILILNIFTGTAVWIVVLLLGINLIGGKYTDMAKSKIIKANEKIAEAVTGGYKKIEKGVVDGYKKIEHGVVGGYKKVETGVVNTYSKIEDKFVEAVVKTVEANEDFVPPYGSGATLYLRPYMFGMNPVIGVKPADEFQFRIFATPVGPYFKGGIKPLKVRISDLDRAAPRGTGNVKAGLNYAMSLYAIVDAHEKGYDENIYVDAATRTNIEETGGANVILIKGNTLVTPKSDSILPSITRRSIVHVAKEYLGMEVEERDIPLSELGDFEECGLCGTAAVISPVGTIDDHGTVHQYAGFGPKIQKLYETLTGIQMGTIEAPEGWIVEIL